MYTELFYLLFGFLAVLLCWFLFVDYRLNYSERVGPKVDSAFNLSSFDLIGGDGKEVQKKEEQLYVFVSVGCSQCKEMLRTIQEEYLDYQDFMTIVVAGEKVNVEKWRERQGYTFPVVCIGEEHLLNDLNISLLPFAVKVKNSKVEGKSSFYEQYLPPKMIIEMENT